jgi:hypothetical protein
MNLLYNKKLFGMLAVVAVTSVACGQNTKVKTITIVNGDTTVSESNLDDELSKLDKDITISVNDDGKGGHSKTIVKKIIIDDGKDKGKDGHAMAYAYSIGDEKDMDGNADVQISTGENGETKVIVKKMDKGEKGEKEGKEEKMEKGDKKVITKTMTIDTDEKSSMNLNLNVSKGVAKVDIETGSKDPINISVLDENGKQVFYDTQKDGSKYSKEIKLEKKGTYFMNIIQNKKSTSEKIIVD